MFEIPTGTYKKNSDVINRYENNRYEITLMTRFSEPYTNRHNCDRNFLSTIKFQYLEIIIETASLSISPATLLMKKDAQRS